MRIVIDYNGSTAQCTIEHYNNKDKEFKTDELKDCDMLTKMMVFDSFRLIENQFKRKKKNDNLESNN